MRNLQPQPAADGFEKIANAICFQENPYDDDYFGFRVSSRRKDGEMSVGKGFDTFEAHVAKLCEKWLDGIAG